MLNIQRAAQPAEGLCQSSLPGPIPGSAGWDPGDLEQERQSGWKGSVPVLANQSAVSVGRKKRLLQGFKTEQLHPGLSLSRGDVGGRFSTAGGAVTIARWPSSPCPAMVALLAWCVLLQVAVLLTASVSLTLESHLNASGETAVV